MRGHPLHTGLLVVAAGLIGNGAANAQDPDPSRVVGSSIVLPITPPATHSQYAVKFVCGATPAGVVPTLVERGQYLTAINIHNPTNEIVEYRFKTARAGLATQDGPISPFSYGTTGPDGAQVFLCGRHIVPNLPGLNDGFFVIESRLGLDVTAVYTAADLNAGVSSIHVDRIASRPVSSFCRRNLDIDLSLPQNWALSTGSSAITVPSGTVGAWDSGRTWMSYVANGNAGTNQNFSYQLNFCSCSSQGGTLAGDVKSDNTSTGIFNAPSGAVTNSFTVGGTGNFSISAAAVPLTPASFQGGGNGSLVATVTNVANPTGISFRGTMHLSYGYLGRCQ